MSYAIKMEFTYGWDFLEFREDEDGDREPVIYDTKEEAERELEYHIQHVHRAFMEGKLDSPYEDDCKVVNLKEEI